MTVDSIWHDADFRRLYGSTISFSLATQVYQLAMPLILFELTRSAGTMTTMRAIELLPNLLFAMFIGVWVDRLDRGRLARIAMVGMVALMGAQAAMLGYGAVALPFFFVTAFVLMTLNYLYGICRMGMIKEMLPVTLLLPATSQLTVLQQLFAVLGPVLAGSVLAWRLEAGLWLPMVALLAAAWLLRGAPMSVGIPNANGYWHEWRDGWRVLSENRPLWHLSWLVVLTNASAGVVEVLFLFRARDQLHLGVGELGLIYGLAGLGGVAGGVLCSRMRQRWGLGRVWTIGLTIEAVCFLTMAWSNSVPVLLLALGGSGFGSVIGNICVWGYRQESTAGPYIGRVSGLTGSLFKLGMPLTLFLAGGLSATLPLAWLLSACAGAHLLALAGTRISTVYKLA